MMIIIMIVALVVAAFGLRPCGIILRREQNVLMCEKSAKKSFGGKLFARLAVRN